MAVEMFSWPSLHERMCRTWGSNSGPVTIIVSNERSHDKTNKMTFAHSKDSDQPGHSPSLIRVFAVRMMKGWVLLATHKVHSEDSDQTWADLRWAHRSFCWFCHAAAQMSSRNCHICRGSWGIKDLTHYLVLNTAIGEPSYSRWLHLVPCFPSLCLFFHSHRKILMILHIKFIFCQLQWFFDIHVLMVSVVSCSSQYMTEVLETQDVCDTMYVMFIWLWYKQWLIAARSLAKPLRFEGKIPIYLML